MKAFGSVAPRPIPGDMGHAPSRDLYRLPRVEYAVSNAAAVGATALDTAPQRTLDIRVLIVDDCALHRDSLAAALAARGLPAACCAWDIETMVAAIRDGAAGVVLLNIATRNSAALLRTALATDPDTRVVVLGVSDDDEAEVIACAEAGVAGYLTRTETFDDLVALLEKVSAGEVFCSPVVSAILLRRLSALASQQPVVPEELALTAREAQILDLLKLGLRNRDIADELCIAVHTVKNHVHSVLTKLGVSTRAEAVALAHTMRPGQLTAGA